MGQSFATSRFVLWVDEVGGFLVCLADRVRIGQAVPNSSAEIALWADISRHQATIARDRDGYFLEPVRETQLNGRELASPAPLASEAQILLGALSGSPVKLTFRRPHALCGSARLDVASRHHVQPKVQGVILMADTCILGPSASNHVVCRNWPKDIVLFRQGKELFCRMDGGLSVDGAAPQRRARLSLTSRVEGEGSSFSLEPL